MYPNKFKGKELFLSLQSDEKNMIMTDNTNPENRNNLNETDFSGENAVESAPKKKKKKKNRLARFCKKFLTFIGSTILSLFLIVIITGTIVATALTVYVMEFMENTDDVRITDMEMSYASYIYGVDKDTGENILLYEVQSTDIQCIPVKIEDVPQTVRNAFVYAEDERFYAHEGIDYKRTFAAFANYFLDFYGSAQGGSTITQQLIKNITGDNDTSPERKIREIFRAMEMEKRYPKDKILEGYLNCIGFGGSAQGVQMAAIKYFGKSIDELSIAEAACLAAIPQNPEKINPFANPEANKKRQEYVLKKMYENGVISTDEYHEALNEKLIFTNSEEYKALNPEPTTIYNFNEDEDTSAENTENTDEETGEKVTPYYVDAAIYEIADYLMEEYDLTQQEAIDKFKKGGYTAYLTIDFDMQEYVEEKYLNYNNFQYAGYNKFDEQPQSSFIAMDYSGNVLAVVGGIGEKTTSLGFNRAVQAKRQPGSCMKPVASYGYALENNKITWSTIFVDKPITYNGEKWPSNYSSDSVNKNWSYSSIYVFNALKLSKNTIPAQICEMCGLREVFDYSTQTLGLDLVEERYDENQGKILTDIDYSPLAVGGVTDGLTIENLVNAYMPYGNGGVYKKAHLISQLVNSADGSIILDNTGDGEQVIDPETSYVMNKLLQQVILSGTGTAAQLSNKTVAGKTGTTSNWNDICFVGLTEDFVSGIWMGYDTPSPLPAYVNSAGVWKNVIGGYANSLDTDASYPDNENVVEAYFCTSTGKLATSRCPRSGSVGYYKSSNAEYCTSH